MIVCGHIFVVQNPVDVLRHLRDELGGLGLLGEVEDQCPILGVTGSQNWLEDV